MKDLQVFYPVDENPDGSELRIRLFSPNGNSQVVEGNAKIEQCVAKLLRTNPNTDYFNPGLGSGMPKILARTVDRFNFQARQAEMAQSIVRVESQILSSQGGLTLPPSERLRSITIRRLEFDFDTNTWNIDLKLTMEDDNAGRILLSLPLGG